MPYVANNSPDAFPIANPQIRIEHVQTPGSIEVDKAAITSVTRARDVLEIGQPVAKDIVIVGKAALPYAKRADVLHSDLRHVHRRAAQAVNALEILNFLVIQEILVRQKTVALERVSA